MRNQTLEFMQANFGKAGAYYYWISRGVDNREVRANRIRKSVGAENTFSSDLTDFDAMAAELQPLIDKVSGAKLGIGSIGVQTFTSSDTAWTWGIDTVLPMRDHQAEGRGADHSDCMVKFRKAWESQCKQPGWLDEFLAVKRRPR